MVFNQASDSAAGTCFKRVLMLLVEPTPYIVPRALMTAQIVDAKCDLIFVSRDSTQNWGKDVNIGAIPVLLEKSASWLTRMARVSRLLNSILRSDYDAAHLAGWGHWVLLLVIMSCKLRGIPFSVESDTQLSPSDPKWKDRLKGALYPVLMKWPAAVIPGGTRQAQFFRHYGVPEDRIHVSYMTVDVESIVRTVTPARNIFRQVNGIKANEVVVLFVGRLVPQKGISILIEAFKIVVANQPHVRLIIIGDGPEHGLVSSAISQENGRVKMIGRQPQEGVISWMRAADIFVLPSFREPWGLVVNEAMTCKLPVIASKACGCADDLVVPERNGLLFETGDPSSLAAQILRLVSSPTLRQRMSRESEAIIAPWNTKREAQVFRDSIHRMIGLK